MTRLRLTKELLVCAVAIVVAGGTIRSRLAIPISPGPLPPVPAVESAAEVFKDEIPVAKPRLVAPAGAQVAAAPDDAPRRDPFAVSDIWENPIPAPLPLPPEIAEERIIPILSIGGGRARAPQPPRIATLPKAAKEPAKSASPPAAEQKP